MSASPVLVNTDEKEALPPYPLKVQIVIDAMMDFINQKNSGVLEVHFSQGGIAKVFANHTKTYK